jgi:hypothetical protein
MTTCEKYGIDISKPTLIKRSRDFGVFRIMFLNLALKKLMRYKKYASDGVAASDRR